MSPEFQKRIQEVVKELGSQGSVMKAGWIVFNEHVVHPSASPFQRSEMKLAFYAGASYIFDSIFHSMDEGDEPTPGDLERMSKLRDELVEFEKTFRKERGN